MKQRTAARIVPGGLAIVTLAFACLPAGNPRTVYRIERWTLNDIACDTEGRDNRQAFEDSFAVNPEASETAGGMPFVVTATCSGSNCIARTDRADLDAWKMDRVAEGVYFRDLIVPDFVGDCSGYVESRALTLVAEPRTFRMERRRYPYSLSSASCTDDERRAAAAANVCNYLEVIEGPFDREEQEPSDSNFDDD